MKPRYDQYVIPVINLEIETYVTPLQHQIIFFIVIYKYVCVSF